MHANSSFFSIRGAWGQSLRMIACQWMREEKFFLFGKIFKNGCKMPTNVL